MLVKYCGNEFGLLLLIRLVILFLWKKKACALCQFLTATLSETESKTLRDKTLTTCYSGTPLYSLCLVCRDVKLMNLAKKLVRFQFQQMLYFLISKIYFLISKKIQLRYFGMLYKSSFCVWSQKTHSTPFHFFFFFFLLFLYFITQ